MNDNVKRDLEYIKLANPKDYQALLIAGHLYCENSKSDEPDEMLGRNMLAVVKDLLDKHNVSYVDDLTEIV